MRGCPKSAPVFPRCCVEKVAERRVVAQATTAWQTGPVGLLWTTTLTEAGPYTRSRDRPIKSRRENRIFLNGVRPSLRGQGPANGADRSVRLKLRISPRHCLTGTTAWLSTRWSVLHPERYRVSPSKPVVRHVVRNWSDSPESASVALATGFNSTRRTDSSSCSDVQVCADLAGAIRRQSTIITTREVAVSRCPFAPVSDGR